ncbi:hypothetical protein ABIF42_000148 [Bradyrhizobium diazoefficiens]
MNGFGPNGITKAKRRARAAGELCGGHVRLERVALDRRLDAPDRIGPHPRPVVQHTIHRRETDTRLAGDVLQRQRGGGESIGHG